MALVLYSVSCSFGDAELYIRISCASGILYRTKTVLLLLMMTTGESPELLN